MTPINALPDLPWTPQAVKEIERAGPDLIPNSDFAWRVGDLFIAGWAYPTLVGPPWFWFALTTNFERQHVRRLMELRPNIPANAHTAVAQGYAVGDRFARFFGFKPTGETADMGGEPYLLYRRD